MKKIWQQKAVLISIGIVILTILYHLSAPTADTPYNYFTRLANAFIHGHIWLNENPSWLNELIPAGNNKYYVPYPPMPAIIAVPLVAIFGVDIGQQWIAHVLQAIATITMAAIAGNSPNQKK
jgi:4-amino-4-deoxy-L-arabinose transferase-like glycosyltransferase